jgi:hypothetical protein
VWKSEDAGAVVMVMRADVVSEVARSPRVEGLPHPRLRRVLSRGYAGFTDATESSSY